jgi:alkylation response protein AidB-like acyl-CoA dehydrogenase
MQLDLTDDQSLFHETTLRFVEAELPLASSRGLHDSTVGFDRSWLQKAAELGWFAMLVPEALGGGSVSDSGLLDLCLVADVHGRHVQPGPFVPMNVVAGAIAAHGSPRLQSELLPALVGGETVATWAFADGTGEWDLGADVNGTRTGDTIVVTGTRGFVQDLVGSDVVLVTVTLDGEPAEVVISLDAEGVTMRPLEGLDLSRRFAHLDLDGVTVPADAVVSGGPAHLDRQLQVAVVLSLAETVGAMDHLFDMTVEYAKDRIAFGRPIGSFQAIKHVLADQALYLETSKAGAVAAAKAVSADADDVGEVVSMVAASVGDQAHELAQECLQVHGGIGYTWEHDLHLLMRRIQTNVALYGEPSWHRERVCRWHRLGEGVAR